MFKTVQNHEQQPWGSLVSNIKTDTPGDNIVNVETYRVNRQTKCVVIHSIW
jgi:hypothetical protein